MNTQRAIRLRPLDEYHDRLEWARNRRLMIAAGLEAELQADLTRYFRTRPIAVPKTPSERYQPHQSVILQVLVRRASLGREFAALPADIPGPLIDRLSIEANERAGIAEEIPEEIAE